MALSLRTGPRYGPPMAQRYARLPARSNLDHAEVHRSTRHLHGVASHIELVVRDRSFRMWTLLTLNALDIVTTLAILSLGGTESNPAMVSVMERWWTPILVKGGVLALMWMVVLRTPLRSKVAEVGLVLAWVFYAGVVLWNTLLLINH